MKLDLQGRVAIVTGASRGIGRAVALGLAGEGVSVLVNYHTHAEEAHEVVAAVRVLGSDALAVQADVADPSMVEHMITETLGRWGRLDVLVNNAGIWPQAMMAETSVDEWQRVLATNLTSVFLCCKAAREALTASTAGRIVNLSSIAALRGAVTGHAHYAAAKGGIIAFSRSLSRELAPAGITVNVVAPGVVETDMLQLSVPGRREYYIAQVPLERLATPDEIANVVVFLASGAASYITGAVINVNGGMFMGGDT